MCEGMFSDNVAHLHAPLESTYANILQLNAHKNTERERERWTDRDLLQVLQNRLYFSFLVLMNIKNA